MSQSGLTVPAYAGSLARTLGLAIEHRGSFIARRQNIRACLEVLRSCAQAAKLSARPPAPHGERTGTWCSTRRSAPRTVAPSITSQGDPTTQARSTPRRIHPTLRTRRILSLSWAVTLQEACAAVLAGNRLRLVEGTNTWQETPPSVQVNHCRLQPQSTARPLKKLLPSS